MKYDKDMDNVLSSQEKNISMILMMGALILIIFV